MELYFIIAAGALAISAGITFATKKVTNQHMFAHLVLFPAVYLALGLPIEGLSFHYLVAIGMYVLGFLGLMFLSFGGGVGRAMVIAGIWIPNAEILLDFFFYAPLLGFFYAIVAGLIKKSNRLDHYAAVLLAAGCGLLASEYKPASQTAVQVSAPEAPIAPADRPLPKLRGT